MVKVCLGANHDESPCNRGVLKGEKWCIFHHPKKSAEMINFFSSMLSIEIEQQKQDHPDYIDFTGFHFPKIMVFEMDFPTTYLMNSCFHSDVIFRKKKSGKVVFHSEVDISQMTVKGIADFRDVEIKGHLEAFDVKFKKKACFSNAVFDSVDFAYSEFYGEADFTGARFISIGIFWFSIFEGKAIFDNAIFENSGAFSDIRCKDVISFQKAKILKYPLDFTDSRCEKGIVIDEEMVYRYW